MNNIIDTETLDRLGFSRNEPSEPRNQLGQKDFMQLMVTQMRNQDPFKPMENGEFIAQMAQFGTMAGIGDLKDSLTQLTTSLVSNQSLQAASLIGHTVKAQNNNALLSANTESIKGTVILPSGNGATVVNVYNQAGNLIKRINLANGTEFAWNGTDEEGARLGPGRYYFSAETMVSGRNEAANILIESKITSVGLGGGRGGGITLSLDNGDELNFNQIRQIL